MRPGNVGQLVGKRYKFLQPHGSPRLAALAAGRESLVYLHEFTTNRFAGAGWQRRLPTNDVSGPERGGWIINEHRVWVTRPP